MQGAHDLKHSRRSVLDDIASADTLSGPRWLETSGHRSTLRNNAFDNLSPAELEEIRRFVEKTDIDVIDDDVRGLVEKLWPWLVAKLPPRTPQ